jgi:zinc and cadmium transporter
MSPLVLSLLATLWVSAIALVGIVFFFTRRPSERGNAFLLSFAAGVLLATSFLELIPEAVHKSEHDENVFVATLGAMIGFFLLERWLHGFHVHDGHDSGHVGHVDRHAVTSRYLILVGDGLHNFIDGVIIAASFAVSPELGFTTTLAVTVHEVPQELADFGILIGGGFTRERALFLNFVSGLTCVLGALAFFAISPAIEGHIAWFMTATAGMFIYIAGSDLIPQLHHHADGLSTWIYMPFLGGVALIAVLGAVIGH